jgi:hypothetical protein
VTLCLAVAAALSVSGQASFLIQAQFDDGGGGAAAVTAQIIGGTAASALCRGGGAVAGAGV